MNIFYVLSIIMNRIPLIFLPFYYILYLFPRDENIWVFGSSFGKSFTGNPKYLFIYANSIEDNIRPIWISRNISVVNNIKRNEMEAYYLYSIKGIYYSLRAKKYIFDHYTKDISFWLSAGSIKLNLWHAIPFKKGHRDNKFDYVRCPRNLWDKIIWFVRRIQNEKKDHYYSVTSNSNYEIFMRSFKSIEENTWILGSPRNDILIDTKIVDSYNNLILDNSIKYNELNQMKKDGKRICMYMPTHRPSEEKIFEIIDFGIFNTFLKENNIIFLLKLHQFSIIKEKIENIQLSNIILIDYKYDPYPYLGLSDLLITDYSSIFFDYLLTKKPIIFFSYDLDIYKKESRELYYEYENVAVGPITFNMMDLENAILLSLNNKWEVSDKYLDILNFTFNNIELSSPKIYRKFKNLVN